MAALSTIIDELTALASDIGALGDPRTRQLAATHTPTTASQLEVATKNGAIDVHPSEGDDLVVEAVAKTRHEDDDLDAVALDVTEADDTISVTVDVPDTNRGTAVELDVGVPNSLALSLAETKNGKVDVRDVHGDARIEAKNGKISVDDVDGVVDVHARNGAISITDTHVTSATSRNGRLDLRLPGIDADTTVESKNGKLSIRVPADTDATFDLSAKTGKADVDGLTCLVEASSRSHVRGELGSGGPHLDAHTKNGTVTLRAR